MFTIHAVKNTQMWVDMELGKSIPDLANTIFYDNPEMKQFAISLKDDADITSEIKDIISRLKRDLDLAINKLDSYDLFQNSLSQIKDLFIDHRERHNDIP